MIKAGLKSFSLILTIFYLLSGILTCAKAVPSLRSLKLLVVADQNFIRQDLWQRIAAAYITDASQWSQEVLNISLEITGYRQWRHPDDSDFYRLTSTLVDEIKADSADAIIAFTLLPRPARPTQERLDGMTIPFRGMMIKTYQGTLDGNQYIPYIILHELVHLFGGLHVKGNNLMNASMAGDITLVLDPTNEAILNATRFIDFKRGFLSLDSMSIQELKETYGLKIAAGDYDSMAASLFEEICRETGRFDWGIEIFRAVVARDSSNLEAWLFLGDNFSFAHEADSAIVVFETARMRFPDCAQIYAQLAILYFNTGEYQKSCFSAGQAEKRGARVDSILWRALKLKGCKEKY